MGFKRVPQFLAVTILVSFLVGCGGSSYKTPVTPAIAVTFQTPPPTTLAVNGTASLAAVVANDVQNSGVDWAITCYPQPPRLAAP